MERKRNIAKNKARRRRFYKRKSFWSLLLVLALLGGLACLITAERYTREYRERAATYDLDRINDLEVPSLIVDRNGVEIGRFFFENRSVIPIASVPQNFIDALTAGEDSRFFSHDGVDYVGVGRAAWLTYKGSSQGASTITQQLARNAYGLKGEALKRNESVIERKLVEAFLARRIEKRYSKQQILEFYLNRIYFGSGFYGIRSASLGYYGKEPLELDTGECASLVTLIKSPQARSPLNNPKRNREGRDYVLSRMYEEGTVSAADLVRLRSLPLSLNPKPLRRGTSHLYERVAEALTAALGADALGVGGYKIHTTILADAQSAAEKALRESLAKAEADPSYTRPKYNKELRNGTIVSPDYIQGAVLMVDHATGEVLAHVGGRDYAQVPYDFIESGRRPLGTAFFPFIYAAGLSAGNTPSTLVEDEHMDNRAVMIGGVEGILGEWGMEVAKPTLEHQIPLRRALEASKIAATVRFGTQIGLQRVVDAAVAFGFPMAKTELLPRLCVGWEGASMKEAVRAFATFGHGGKSGPSALFYVDRVEDPKGSVIYRRQPTTVGGTQVIDDATAYQVHSIMSGSLDHGSAAGARDGLVEKPFHGAGKGGTTADFTDTWFLGYNSRITCGVWTGFLQGAGGPIYRDKGAFSRDLSMPVWQAAMNAAAPSFGGDEMKPPASVVEVPICSVSGQRATNFCQEQVEDIRTGTVRSESTAFTEYFRRGTEKVPFCTVHSGGLAEGISPGLALSALPVLNVVAVRSQAPVLLGDDPYHTDIPSIIKPKGKPGLVQRGTNVLDSLDIGDKHEGIPLRRPRRLIIFEE